MGIFLFIVAVIYLILLELSKNTLIGWAIGIGCVLAFYVFRTLRINQGKWNGRELIIGFICLLLLLCANYKLTEPPIKRVSAVNYKTPQSSAVVHVAQGDLTGVYNESKTVEIYAGIPYAKPPVGDLRWREPQAPDKWKGIRKCDVFGPKAMQPESSVIYSSLSQIHIRAV